MLSLARVASSSAAAAGLRATAARAAVFEPVRFSSAAAADETAEEETAPTSRLSITNPLIAWPLGVAASVPAIHHGLYHINEETQLACCFAMFMGIFYTQAGPAAGAFFAERADAIQAEQNAAEQAQIDATTALLDSYKAQLGALEDLDEIYAAQTALVKTMSDAKAAELRADVRNAFVKKLDQLGEADSAVLADLHSTIVNTTTARVAKSFQSDAKLQENAMKEALELVAIPEAKYGEVETPDVVAGMYRDYLQTFAQSVEKLRGTTADAVADAAATEDMNRFKLVHGWQDSDAGAQPAKFA